MIELGYMAKRISVRPDWLDVPAVHDIYAVSNCISEDFCEYADFWMHNGFWFFDSPEQIRRIARENHIELSGTCLLYYRGHEKQFDADQGAWTNYFSDAGFVTNIIPPPDESRIGFDIVTYWAQNSPECSPLSCNHMASEVDVNEHCLIDSFDYAIDRVENGVFNDSEPGPYRVVEVNAVRW